MRECAGWLLSVSLVLVLISAACAGQPVQAPQAGAANQNAAESLPPLPKGFEPPPKRHPFLDLDKPLLTDAEEAALSSRKAVTNFKNALNRAGALQDQDKQALRDGARLRVYKMTMKKHRESLRTLRDEILRDLESVQRIKKGNTPARLFLLGEIKDRAAELLDNNLYVRISAAFLLQKLNKEEGYLIKKIPGVAYVPAAAPLLAAVVDKEQHVAVKIVAVTGLSRILTEGEPADVSKRAHDIARALVAQLDLPDLKDWYQWRLVEALGATGIGRDRASGEPFVIQQLAKVMADERRNWIVRCEAARSLGRVPLAGVNVSPLVYELVNLAHQMALRFDQKPTRYPWQSCFEQLFVAFRPENVAAVTPRPGLLQQNVTTVREAYEMVVAMRNHIQTQSNAKMSAELLNKVQGWLQNKKPTSFTIAPGQAPFTTRGDRAVPAAAPNE